MFVRPGIDKDISQILYLYKIFEEDLAPPWQEVFLPQTLVLERNFQRIVGYAWYTKEIPHSRLRHIVTLVPETGSLFLKQLPYPLIAWSSVRNLRAINFYIKHAFRAIRFYEVYNPKKGRNSQWLLFLRKTPL